MDDRKKKAALRKKIAKQIKKDPAKKKELTQLLKDLI